jgi:hypothetical protein
MSTNPAPGFVTAGALKGVAPAISIYDLKSVGTAQKLAKLLARGKVVPLARTRSTGEVIEFIGFAVPEEALLGKAMRSQSTFEWRRLRRHPREAVETARLLQRALEISGLEDDVGDEVTFLIVPDDSEALFTDIEEDRETAKVMALQRLAASLEELVTLLRPKLPPVAESGC